MVCFTPMSKGSKNMVSDKTIISAAGGLVINEDERFLMIYRRGFWDLPKGKQDEDEDLEHCAVREVMEECGLADVWIGRFLCETVHDYNEENRAIEKRTAWYLMLAPGEQELVPQVEEDIECIGWFTLDECKKLLELSYPTIKEVFAAFLKTTDGEK